MWRVNRSPKQVFTFTALPHGFQVQSLYLGGEIFARRPAERKSGNPRVEQKGHDGPGTEGRVDSPLRGGGSQQLPSASKFRGSPYA